MKSVNGVNWKLNNIKERLILKKKQDFNISYLLSKIFLEKKYSDEQIYKSTNNLKQPDIIYHNKDFIHASEFIIQILENNKKILIFGDYDVDGYSSTYLLYDFFSAIKISCDYYIPDRFLDGYGPNKLLLKKLLKKNNYGLVIFVDCGSNSYDEINYLNSCGLKVIVIDHHKIHIVKTSTKSVIINPLKNNLYDEGSFFCATSLVYFFIKYLIKKLKIKNNIYLKKYLFFSAIATICDQMSLRGHNKDIIINGLKNFDLSKFQNFKKLINLKRKIKASDFGFTLGPILNSSSRLGDPNLPFKLLIEKKTINIEKISKKLIDLNEKRKKIQIKTIDLLRDESENKKNEVIFKYKKNINEGILGIIAANFVELFNRPSFILTNSGDFIKCSSRSIRGFDIGNIFYFALKNKIIIKGGGHSMAGGCTLKQNKLQEFKNFLNTHFESKFANFKNIKFYSSDQSFNSLLTFAKNEFKFLEPLINDNINPYFKIKNNRIVKFKVINDTHLHILIKNKYNKSCVCFAFNTIGSKLGYLLMNTKKEVDLIVQINNNNVQKNTDFNLIIKDAIA